MMVVFHWESLVIIPRKGPETNFEDGAHSFEGSSIWTVGIHNTNGTSAKGKHYLFNKDVS